MVENYGKTRVFVEATVATAPYAAAAIERAERGLLDESWLAGGPVSPVAEPSEEGATVDGKWWSAAEIRRVRDELPYAGVLALLDLCAQRAGEWVAKADADAQARMEPRQLASGLSALTKFVRRELQRDGWPIEWRKLANTYSYRMSTEAAAIWRA